MSAIIPVPAQTDVNTALRAFLLAIMPAGMAIVRGQVNRVPEPNGQDFIVFWPLHANRLTTNIDHSQDTVFTASITGTVMTVTAMQAGSIVPPVQLFGVGLSGGTATFVTAQLTGSVGAVGTYTVTPSQTVGSSTISAGTTTVTQETEIVMQLDVHGPSSWNNAQVISTLFRDAYAVDFFNASYPTITPLYADDPRQSPFVNAEQQYEDRWIIEARLQANQTVPIPQQYAGVVDIVLASVEVGVPIYISTEGGDNFVMEDGLTLIVTEGSP